MRLLLVNPNTNAATTATMLRIARRAAPDGVLVEGATVARGAPLLADEAQLAIGAAATQELIAATDLASFGGVIVAAFGDPGLEACRAISPVPVTGIAEAAMAEAAALGRFVIATTTRNLVAAIEARAASYGYGASHLGTWLTRGDAAAVMADPGRLEAALGDAVAEAIAAVAPDAVIIGGGPLAEAAAALRPRFAVPLIEPVPAAIRLAVRRAAFRA
jgi:Asp/Glu/hydantoin racemase